MGQGLVIVAGAGFPDEPLLGHLVVLVEGESEAAYSVLGQTTEHFGEAGTGVI